MSYLMSEQEFTKLTTWPEDSILIAPSEFTALLIAYEDTFSPQKAFTAPGKIEREVIMDLIQKWLSDPSSRKRIAIVKNLKVE